MLTELKNKALDSSIIFSFDRSGYLRHQEAFQATTTDLDFEGPILITGGTSGIGEACAESILSKNVDTYVSGRSAKRAENIIAKGAKFLALDMADWQSFDKIIQDLPVLSALVLNAGGMPDRFATNEQGLELQMASQLYGHYYFILRLIKAGKLKKAARIVWVSSGGMYLKKLHLDNLEQDTNYDKVSTYANVKRAQVVLNQEMAKDKRFSDYIINAMHPGWVDTPGVAEAIPKFKEKTEGRLRSPIQGGDTILWLLSNQAKITTSGQFYFDRELKSIYAFFWTKEKASTREALLSDIEKRYKQCFGLE